MHVKCPRCDGTGEVSSPFTDYNGEPNAEPCVLCSGRGHVGKEKFEDRGLLTTLGNMSQESFDRLIKSIEEEVPYWNQDDHRREER